MSKWDKLIAKICSLSRKVRFDELRRVMESFGYEMKRPSGGGSHCTFRKRGCAPVTIPVHEPIKRTYVLMVKELIESEGLIDEDD